MNERHDGTSAPAHKTTYKTTINIEPVELYGALQAIQMLLQMCQWCDEEIVDPKAPDYILICHDLAMNEVTRLIDKLGDV